jgi:predicted nucleotidyltransferase component of viral defense system
MNTEEIGEYVKKLGISRDQIVREEAEMSILEQLSQDPIGSRVVFYGGTALRLAYGSPRFSEDIDLLCVKPVAFSDFHRFVSDVAETAGGQWKLSDVKEKRKTLFALLTIRDENLKHAFSVKIEAHRPKESIALDTELLLLKSPVSLAEPLLLVPRLQELKRLKEAALVGRKKARDIFDLWYISQSLREEFVLPDRLPEYSKREFSNELQVFLPQKYYPVIRELYEKLASKNESHSA